MKLGFSITLHKGNRKRKDDLDNYRVFTLLSTLLKLYERILLNRIGSMFTVYDLQGWFQKQRGCLFTSFLLRESVAFAKENNSKLYVCHYIFLKHSIVYDIRDYFISCINMEFVDLLIKQ